MATETKTPTIKRIKSWTIPFYGNRHTFPYGVLVVSDGTTTKECRTIEDGPLTYITFNRKRYEVVEMGSLHSPSLTLRAI